jgi:hypothetical protein
MLRTATTAATMGLREWPGALVTHDRPSEDTRAPYPERVRSS